MTDLDAAVERVLMHCRFKMGELVGYDQTEDGLDALFDLYQEEIVSFHSTAETAWPTNDVAKAVLLGRQLLKQQSPDGGYPCSRCPASFVTREGREIHQNLEHSQFPDFGKHE
jgi:hypothetical protein